MEDVLMLKRIAMLCFCLFTLTACGADDSPESTESCAENEPEQVAGMKVKGTRSEKNVIHNMWPVVCRAREFYRERLKEDPKLKGTIELKLVVEFNGEIGPFSISRSTVNDEELEKQVLYIIQFLDFDPYGSRNSESEILFPMHFKP
jgi:hypothetical protein